MQSVSSLTQQIKSLLEATFLQVRVKGEVSRLTYHTSGHLYFTLKDEKSSISCVMFRGNNQKLKFRLEEGMEVNISGAITVFAPRGVYQLNCFTLEPSGSGALALAYEQLKKELDQKGYFQTKRQLPKIPKHIAIVTSKTGAALQDMLKVANTRWPLVKITLFDTLVQGEGASKEIASAILKAQSMEFDIIVIGRGGGSVEDLWAFNEREVADALFNSKIPTVSAVGHAIDTLISDFVADLSAPTPSAAMELILPDINEFKITLDNIFDIYKTNISHRLQNAQKSLEFLQKQMSIFSPEIKLKKFEDEILNIKQLLKFAINQKFDIFSSHIEGLNLAFKSKNPEILLKNGYAQIIKSNNIINLHELKQEDIFQLQGILKTVTAKVLKIDNNHKK